MQTNIRITPQCCHLFRPIKFTRGDLSPRVLSEGTEAVEIQVRKQSDCSKNQGLKNQLDDQK